MVNEVFCRCDARRADACSVPDRGVCPCDCHTRAAETPSGVKHDTGKTDWTLIPWEGLGAVVEVLSYGARKYSRDNWRVVPDARDRYVKATLRHVVSLARGQWADPESGLPHAAHAACCLLFVLALASEETPK